MFVVLPFCAKDSWLTVKHLTWAFHLDGKVNFHALLSFERGVDHSIVLESANQYFASVNQITYDPWQGQQSWPYPQNWAFQSTARLVKGMGRKDPAYAQGWLWWESDACPVRKGWLQAIAEEYDACAKPFMGHVHEMMPGRPHMNGAGCYPWNVSDYSRMALMAKDVPWDVAARDEIAPHASNANHLFQHVWGDQNNQPLTFPNYLTVHRKVNLKGALFHRCKDGTLCDRLFEREKPPPPPEQVEREAKKQHWSSFMRERFKLGRKREKLVQVPFLLKTRRGRLIHVVEKHYTTKVITGYHGQYPDNQDSVFNEYRRQTNALNSWLELYKTGRVIPCHVWDPPRTSADVGDFRKLPYLKDLLVEGLTLAKDNDWLVLTNDDTILHPKLPDLIDNLPAGIEAVSSFRIEFDKGSPISTDMDPPSLAKLYDRDLGRDLFAFSAQWVKENWFEIPDFFMGEVNWDLVMTLLIRDKLGIFTDHSNILAPIPEVEMPMGYVLHERHVRQWQKLPALNPAKTHNCNLAKAWCKEHGYNYPITAPKKAVVLEHPNGELQRR